LAVGIRDFTIVAEAGEIALKLKDRAAVRNYLPEAVSLYAIGSIRRCGVRPDRGLKAEHAT